jgi:hypothetical protein
LPGWASDDLIRPGCGLFPIRLRILPRAANAFVIGHPDRPAAGAGNKGRADPINVTSQQANTPSGVE